MLEKEIINYKENKEEILHWVLLKGEYRYNAIIEFLKRKKIERTWENITYYIKYDKRILINSFKYLAFLEELYKSFIKENKTINQKKLLRLEFSESLDEYLSIGNDANYDGIDLQLLNKEKKTITEFRNSVVHNKILLIHSYNGKSLEEVLNIFVKILPKSYRKGYIKDINCCSKGIVENLWNIRINEGEIINEELV